MVPSACGAWNGMKALNPWLYWSTGALCEEFSFQKIWVTWNWLHWMLNCVIEKTQTSFYIYRFSLFFEICSFIRIWVLILWFRMFWKRHICTHKWSSFKWNHLFISMNCFLVVNFYHGVQLTKLSAVFWPFCVAFIAFRFFFPRLHLQHAACHQGNWGIAVSDDFLLGG